MVDNISRPKEWMSSRRRFLSAVFGGRVDRTPAGNPASIATVEQMQATGCYFPDVHFDAEKMATLAAAGHDIIGFDTIMPVFSAYTEVAALGCEMSWGSETELPISSTAVWNEPSHVSVPHDFLERPPIKVVLDAISLLRRKYGNRVAIVGKVMGPWTLATEGYGIESLLMETITDADRVKDFLRRLCEIVVEFGKAQIAAGADVLTLGEGGSGDVISPQAYHELLFPFHKELIQELGCPVMLHICGNSTARIGYIADGGFDCFHFDYKVDAKKAVELVGNKISLIGNIDNAYTMCYGTPVQVKGLVRYALEAGVQVIAPGCTTAPTTPNKNLTAIVDAIREFYGIDRAN